jgi:hypothetical protein
MARARTGVALPAFIGSVMLGWWATGLDPFSGRATAVVLAAGVIAMVPGGARRAAESPRHIAVRAAAPWAVLVGALAAWQGAAYVQHPRSDHPTLSSLTNTALDPRTVRTLAFAGWLIAAGWLARR